MFCNEEDLKNKVILPYLQDIGFQPSDVSFEKGFSIRLGRAKYKIGSEDGTARGRLDILCRNGERNLFVIEVKDDSKDLEQEDIDQGISYARLLDNIPPFVLVTNGKNTIIVDSITKALLTGTQISSQSNFWANGCRLDVDHDLSVRYQALRHFISISPTNMRSFSIKQIENRMGTIVGAGGNKDAKYNFDTHVTRKALESEFREFLLSDFPVFAILGDSGVGKTSSLCHLCFEASNSELALFYNAALLGHPLLEAIAGDLNLFFSGTTVQDKVLSVLTDIAMSSGKQVVMFVDAIDENSMQHFRYELSELALRLKSIKNVKLCISCKLNLWPLFLSINGNETYLKPSVFVPTITIAKSDNLPGFVLSRFSDSELDDAILKYRHFFGLKGDITPELREELRHGFFLQVVSQVYFEKVLPAHIIDKELLESYLRLKLSGISPDRRGRVLKILVTTAKLMLEKASNVRHEAESISAERIALASNISMFDDLPSELFSSYFLIRTNELYDQNVSFYFSRIRDYLLVEYAFGLSKMPLDDLEKELPKFFNGIVGFSAMYFFSESCTAQQRAVLQRHTKYKVTEYLYAYSDYITRNFYNTKASFDPNTTGDIGILIPSDTASLHGGYALFPIEESTSVSPVVELPSLSVFGDNSAFSRYRARVIHGSYLDLVKTDTNESVRNSVAEQLKKIIEEMRLNETTSMTLDIEKVLHILYRYRKELGYSEIKDHFMPRFESMFPIDLIEVKRRVHRFFAVEFFKNEYLKEQISSGRIPVVNSTISYSEKIFDWTVINTNVEAAIQSRAPIVPLSIGGNYPPFVYLDNCIDRLVEKGVSQIETAHLPQPDVQLKDISQTIVARKGRDNWIPDILVAQYSDSQIKSYISGFFQLVEQAYTELVESCFPLMKESFIFYSTRPHSFYVRLVLDKPDAWQFTHGYRTSLVGQVETVFVEDDLWAVGFEKYGLMTYGSSSLDTIFENRLSSKQFVPGIDTSKVDEKLIVRSWTYDLLKRDLEALERKSLG